MRSLEPVPEAVRGRLGAVAINILMQTRTRNRGVGGLGLGDRRKLESSSISEITW